MKTQSIVSAISLSCLVLIVFFVFSLSSSVDGALNHQQSSSSSNTDYFDKSDNSGCKHNEQLPLTRHSTSSSFAELNSHEPIVQQRIQFFDAHFSQNAQTTLPHNTPAGNSEETSTSRDTKGKGVLLESVPSFPSSTSSLSPSSSNAAVVLAPPPSAIDSHQRWLQAASMAIAQVAHRIQADRLTAQLEQADISNTFKQNVNYNLKLSQRNSLTLQSINPVIDVSITCVTACVVHLLLTYKRQILASSLPITILQSKRSQERTIRLYFNWDMLQQFKVVQIALKDVRVATIINPVSDIQKSFTNLHLPKYKLQLNRYQCATLLKQHRDIIRPLHQHKTQGLYVPIVNKDLHRLLNQAAKQREIQLRVPYWSVDNVDAMLQIVPVDEPNKVLAQTMVPVRLLRSYTFSALQSLTTQLRLLVPRNQWPRTIDKVRLLIGLWPVDNQMGYEWAMKYIQHQQAMTLGDHTTLSSKQDEE